MNVLQLEDAMVSVGPSQGAAKYPQLKVAIPNHWISVKGENMILSTFFNHSVGETCGREVTRSA